MINKDLLSFGPCLGVYLLCLAFMNSMSKFMYQTETYMCVVWNICLLPCYAVQLKFIVLMCDLLGWLVLPIAIAPTQYILHG